MWQTCQDDLSLDASSPERSDRSEGPTRRQLPVLLSKFKPITLDTKRRDAKEESRRRDVSDI